MLAPEDRISKNRLVLVFFFLLFPGQKGVDVVDVLA